MTKSDSNLQLFNYGYDDFHILVFRLFANAEVVWRLDGISESQVTIILNSELLSYISIL